jgi:hypothetical protein
MKTILTFLFLCLAVQFVNAQHYDQQIEDVMYSIDITKDSITYKEALVFAPYYSTIYTTECWHSGDIVSFEYYGTLYKVIAGDEALIILFGPKNWPQTPYERR